MEKLDNQTQKWLIEKWKESRNIKPFESNWLLFPSIIEAALLEFTGEYDAKRLNYGIGRFRDEWYKGDAWYGDGKDFHLDYYNSLVIHPMLTEVLRIMKNMDCLKRISYQYKKSAIHVLQNRWNV